MGDKTYTCSRRIVSSIYKQHQLSENTYIQAAISACYNCQSQLFLSVVHILCEFKGMHFLQVAEPNLQRAVEDSDVLIFALPFQVSVCGENCVFNVPSLCI